MNNHQPAAPNPSRRAADKLGIEREGGIFSPGQRRDFLAWNAGLDALAKWDQDQDYIDYLESKVSGLENKRRLIETISYLAPSLIVAAILVAARLWL